MTSQLEKASDTLHSFGSKILGNRVFDLYLKYRGIKMLTSTTLVPLALIMGKDMFQEHVLQGQSIGSLEKSVQSGGGIPVLDDQLVGNYLKISGAYSALSNLNSITPTTLVPIGILMVLWEMSKSSKSQSGGGSDMFKKFTKKLVDNRVLDLYLKYRGIKMLNSATLVPVALILGKDVFREAVEGYSGSSQSGGHKIVFLDDPLVGNYLKLSGLYKTAQGIGPNTLLPLGILMVLYELYYKNGEQSGGMDRARRWAGQRRGA